MPPPSTDLAFRFDADRHLYFLGDQVRPSISQMLKAGGLVDGHEFMTEEGKVRGTAVHRLTADYSLGAIEDVVSSTSKYKGYLLAYQAAMSRLQLEVLEVEEPQMHPVYRYGGRSDLVGRLWGLLSVIETKSGGKERWHPIQTALQAMLTAHRYGLKPHQVGRYALYIQETGRYSLERHVNPGDFNKAEDLAREFCF